MTLKVSVGRLIISNFRITDDIILNPEEEEEAEGLVDRLDTATTRYKLETRRIWRQAT